MLYSCTNMATVGIKRVNMYVGDVTLALSNIVPSWRTFFPLMMLPALDGEVFFEVRD